MSKKQRIGVTGPISEVNFGDYAMFVNNFYDLSADEITIFSYNKGFSQKIVNDYLNNMNITNIEVKLAEKKKIQEELKPKVGFLPFNSPTDTPIDILYRVENIEEIRDAISKIDIMIVNGGGYFNHLWNNSLWRSDMLKKIIAPIIIANQMNKEIYFTGNGIGPFDQSEEFFNYIFNYLRNTTYAVRDRLYSKKYLQKIGVSNDNIKFIPDDLYFINQELLDHPLSDAERLLNIGKYVLLELYYPLDELKKYENSIIQFCENIYKNQGLSVIFVPFDFERGGTWQGEYLSEKISNLHLYDLSKSGYLPIQDIYSLVKNAELVICNRYHALVLAISAGVPVVNILKKVCDDYRYYFNKNYGLLEYSFEGLNLNEMDFLHLSLDDSLSFLENNLDSVIANQKKLFSSIEYEQNKVELKKKRKEYLLMIEKEV
jgi:polysaccharide pyruvyl transferase WcaK-like protein